MANVIFKRGLQANLPSTAEDGVFYLTTDTNRLYVGNGSTRKLLNQTVNIVSDLTTLETESNAWITNGTAEQHVQDFYYITSDNILAVWKKDPQNNNQYKWVQINPDTDTTIQSSEFRSSVDTNVATITNTLTDSDGNPCATASFVIAGAGGLQVSQNGTNGVTLTGDTYAMARSITNNNAVITLSSTNNTATNSVVTFQPGENIEFSSTGTSGIVVSAKDTAIQSASLSITANGAIVLELNDSESNTIPAVLNNAGVVLHDNTFVTLGDTSSLSQASKGIYSAAEIDTLINGLDGMTYRGTVGTGGSTAMLPTSDVKNGDTYVVGHPIAQSAFNDVTIVGNIPASGVIVGDMFIASGTETNGVIASGLQWTYVPSGNDDLATVSYKPELTLANNKITIANGNDDPVITLQMSAGDGIALSSVTAVSADGMVTTISHAAYTATTTTADAASASSFEAITGITLTNGHITGITKETFSPLAYKFGDTVAAAANTVNGTITDGTRMANASNSGPNDVTFKINLNDADENAISSAAIKLSSSSIKLAKGNDGEVVMNMEWGTF